MEKRSRKLFFERRWRPILDRESQTGSTMWGREHWITFAHACMSKISAQTSLARPWSNEVLPSETLDQQCLISMDISVEGICYPSIFRQNSFGWRVWRMLTHSYSSFCSVADKKQIEVAHQPHTWCSLCAGPGNNTVANATLLYIQSRSNSMIQHSHRHLQ